MRARSLGVLDTGRVVTPLLDSLSKEKDSEVKRAIVRSLGNNGNMRAVIPLLEIIKSEKSHIHSYDSERKKNNWNKFIESLTLMKETIISLGKLGSTKATEALTNLLEDFATFETREYWNERIDFRVEVIDAIRKIGDTDASDALIRLVKTPVPRYSKGILDYQKEQMRNYRKKIRIKVKRALIQILGRDSSF